MGHRGLRLALGTALVLALGLAYAWVCLTFGVGLPCAFHLVTGLYCPGCGVTHLCLALLRGNLLGAWQANPMIFALLPALAVLGAQQGWRYIKTGSLTLSKWQNILCWILLALLLGFGVLRNIV